MKILNLLPEKVITRWVRDSRRIYLSKSPFTASTAWGSFKVVSGKHSLSSFYYYLFKDIIKANESFEKINQVLLQDLDEVIVDYAIKKFKKSSIDSQGRTTDVNIRTFLARINKYIPHGEKYWFSYNEEGKLSFIKKGNEIIFEREKTKKIKKQGKDVVQLSLNFGFT